MTDFNPDTFMTEQQTVTLDTEYTAIPTGDYPAVIKDVIPRAATGGSSILDIIWLVDDESVRELTGMEEPTCKQGIWLDLDANNHLEGGANKNLGLGKLRDVFGQNDGQPWSPTMLIGQPAMIYIEPDKTGKYTNVTQVAAR